MGGLIGLGGCETKSKHLLRPLIALLGFASLARFPPREAHPPPALPSLVSDSPWDHPNPTEDRPRLLRGAGCGKKVLLTRFWVLFAHFVGDVTEAEMTA